MQLLADILAPIVWPMCFVLVSLLVLRQLRDGVKPIFMGIVSGVAKDASSNARAYGIAILFGLSASFSAFWEVFNTLDPTLFKALGWHQYFALWTKVLNPFVVAVLAYATQNTFSKASPTVTNPPFTTQ